MNAVAKYLNGQDRLSGVIVLAIAVIVAVVAVLVLPRLLPQASPEHIWPSVVFALVFFGVFIAVPVLWGGLSRHSVTPIGAAPAQAGPFGLVLGLGGLLVAVGYAALAGTLVKGGIAANLALLLLGTVLVLYQSAAEEIYFRGWIQAVAGRHFGPWAGLAVSAILFAGMHVVAGVVAGPLSFLNVALAGLLFGLLAWRTGGLVAPVLAHFGWNWGEGILFGLSPNPGADVWTAITDFDMTGSGLWGGSPEGLNASLAVTIVMIALCLPLALWKQASSAPATV